MMADQPCPPCRLHPAGVPCRCECHGDRVASTEETMTVARALAVRHAELLRRLA